STGQRGVSLGTIRERVARLRRVKFHDTVHLTCTVGGNTVHVLKKTAVTDGALIIAGTPPLKECLQLMGLTVAEVVWQGRPPHELITPTIVLVESQDERALRTYLELMGIRYDPSLARKRRLPETPAEEQAVKQLILAKLVNTLGQKPPQHAPTTGTKSTRKSRDPLPALHDVLVQEVGRTGRLPIKQRGGVTRSDASRTPMVPDEQADRALGRHAEALVYRHERERVAAAGYDPDRVVWTAGDDTDNAADYDIASVDDDGEGLRIEVKATRRSDG